MHSGVGQGPTARHPHVSRRRRFIAGVTAAVLLTSAFAASADDGKRGPEGPASLVDPFIGSTNEGNTFPGAAVPFGMVQMSPDTGKNVGYSHDDKRIRGFSPVHLSGVGCKLGGDLPALPTTGDVTETDNAEYAASFSHDKESASPGHYQVRMGDYGGIKAELSATKRTGWQRYTFPAAQQANVLLNSGQALHKVTDSRIRVVDDRTVVSEITGTGFCQETKPYTVHTVTRFKEPFTSHGTWAGDKVTEGSSSSEGPGRRGAYVSFDTRGADRQVEAVTAISYVDAAGAARNLAAEGQGTFDSTVAEARRVWESRLDDIAIEGGSETRRRAFYSALYRALLHPNVGEDADGRYRGWDKRVHTSKGFTYYQNWSLWDTYRTQAQLLSLIAPQESRDMALSLLRVDKEGGWLPKWGYGTVETNVMTGDPATPFLTNAYQQGLLEGHEEETYRVLRKNADGVPPLESQYVGRNANHEYLKRGYVPHEPDRPKDKQGGTDYGHGGSATLEYALADGALAQMAGDLGHKADAKRYAARAANYRKIMDKSTGFFRPRDGRGRFTGTADPSKGKGFQEGTAAQYQWLVPQDVPGLIDLLGGKKAAEKRLDTFFGYDRLRKDPEGTAREEWVDQPYDYYDSDRYNPQNETDLTAPYTYLSTGSPWKTTDVVHTALGLFTDGPDGVTGNDDLGTMSSWMVLSSMGIFPVSPGNDTWGLTTPAFEKVDIDLDRRWYPKGKFRISAPGSDDTDRYVQSARLGGKDLDRTWISTDDIRKGRDLSFRVGSEPSDWGTDPEDAPPSPADEARGPGD